MSETRDAEIRLEEAIEKVKAVAGKIVPVLERDIPIYVVSAVRGVLPRELEHALSMSKEEIANLKKDTTAVAEEAKTKIIEDTILVTATESPIELAGTYPLPEAQLDRFMFNVWLDYPSMQEEINIVKATTTGIEHQVSVVLTQEEILAYQQVLNRIPVTGNVLQYAVNLAIKTRPNTPKAHPFANNYLAWGAGPRASQYLIIGAKAHAVVNGKYSPDIEDVQAVAVPVLRHRIVRNYKAEAEGMDAEKIVMEFLK